MSLDFYIEAEIDTGGTEPFHVTLFDRNITHNLAEMARQCGVYNCLWCPEENGFATAGDIIQTLRDGISQLEDRPAEFQKYNPENGWGDYSGLLAFCRDVLENCVQHPKAKIRAI